MRFPTAAIAAVGMLALLPAGIVTAPARAADAVEKPDLKLSVGGKALLYYLPLTITEQLGYFKEAGLTVEISDFAGGAKSLQALMGGSVDVTTGSYEHTIQMQAQKKPLVALVLLGQYPGIGLGLTPAKAATYKGPQDLKGLKLGVTAPGSSTSFLVSYVLAKGGLKPDDVSQIGVGGGASAVAAMKHGDIDGMSNTDPVISQLEIMGLLKVVVDTRTRAGTDQVYGGSYPAAVLYAPPDFVQKNPKTTQALVTAFVRGLKWMEAATPEQIVAKVPAEYTLGDKAAYTAAIEHSKQMYSPDGLFDPAGAANVLRVLSEFDPNLKSGGIDVAKSYDNGFVQKAQAALK